MKGKNTHRPKLLGILLVGALTAFTLTSCDTGGGEKDNDAQIEAQDTVAQNTDNQEVEAQDTELASNQLAGEQTITGEVLDMSCYMTKGATGKGHQSCAQTCLDKGLPAGIMSEDGQVYLLVENHGNDETIAAYEKALKHAAQNVTISGTVENKNGVQSLTVEKVIADNAAAEETPAKG